MISFNITIVHFIYCRRFCKRGDLKVEIKKTNSARLDNKRGTFFLLGMVMTLSFVFVGLQYQNHASDSDIDSDDLEELAQDLEMNMPAEQKDMVSAEAPSAPVSKSITQEVKTAEKTETAPQKISSTTSELVIGDGEGEVDGSDIKEAVPENVVDKSNSAALAEAPINFTVVQKIPQFPGGWSVFMQWLTKNLKYPHSAQQNKIQGTVVVSFIVNKDGSVANLKVSKSANPILDNEAMRVLKMMPKWKPGMDKNKVCRTMIAIPVAFQL